jgi:hypothetical protein
MKILLVLALAGMAMSICPVFKCGKLAAEDSCLAKNGSNVLA